MVFLGCPSGTDAGGVDIRNCEFDGKDSSSVTSTILFTQWQSVGSEECTFTVTNVLITWNNTGPHSSSPILVPEVTNCYIENLRMSYGFDPTNVPGIRMLATAEPFLKITAQTELLMRLSEIQGLGDDCSQFQCMSLVTTNCILEIKDSRFKHFGEGIEVDPSNLINIDSCEFETIDYAISTQSLGATGVTLVSCRFLGDHDPAKPFIQLADTSALTLDSCSFLSEVTVPAVDGQVTVTLQGTNCLSAVNQEAFFGGNVVTGSGQYGCGMLVVPDWGDDKEATGSPELEDTGLSTGEIAGIATGAAAAGVGAAAVAFYGIRRMIRTPSVETGPPDLPDVPDFDDSSSDSDSELGLSKDDSSDDSDDSDDDDDGGDEKEESGEVA
jgi:hypothetical protein